MTKFKYLITVTAPGTADEFDDLAEVIQTDIEDVLPDVVYPTDEDGDDHELAIIIEMEYKP